MTDITTQTLLKDIRTSLGAIRIAQAKLAEDIVLLLEAFDILIGISDRIEREGPTPGLLFQFRLTIFIIGGLLADIRTQLGVIDNLKEEIVEDLILIGITPPSV